MEFLDIGLNRPAIIPPAIVMTMVYLIMKVLECLQVMEDLDIGLLITYTLPLESVEFIMVVIEVVIMEDMDIGLKRPATLPFTIVYTFLMVTG